MATHDIIVIGASAGGVEATRTLASAFPRDLRAAVFVVLHLSRGRSFLPDILTRAGPLAARHPEDGEPIHYGRIYVAPPDHHMTIEDERIRIRRGPAENGVRPAVDPLFRSAARAYGKRVVGVVLTGSLDDGTAGLAAVKEAGGVTIAQDPEEAFAPSMPRNAMEYVGVDYVLPLAGIGVLLSTLAREQTDERIAIYGPHVVQMESDGARMPLALNHTDRPGQLGVFSCPECAGTLWESDMDGVLRFRCHVGHVYTAESMVGAQMDAVDRALWAALRALEERAALTQRMADRAALRQQTGVARAFADRARVAGDHASKVRSLLTDRSGAGTHPDLNDEEAPAPLEPNPVSS